MTTEKSDPKLRGFADAIVGLEDTINYVLEMAHQQGINMKLEAEVVNMAHSPSRVHLRIVTPDMEVRDVSGQPQKAALHSASGEAAG